jgi:hypothetical protein
MKHLKLSSLKLLLAVAVLMTGGSTMLFAQAGHHDWDPDGDGYRNVQYQQDRDRDWDRDRDRDRDRRGRDRDDDDRYRGNRNGYPYGRGNYGSARQYGYQDGLNDGRNDRQSGHSFRPTHDSNYKHADRGYYGGFGDKNQYKQVYRQGYEQGYQQGYNSGGYGRRRY